MDEAPSMYPSLSDSTHFKLNKINKIKDYVIAEIRERESVRERPSKYITLFDHFDKALIVLSATNVRVYIASFASVIGAPVGLASAILVLRFL